MRSHLKLGVSTIAVAAFSALGSTAAFAQDTAIETVVVTGTSIRGVAPVGSNLLTVDRAAIDTSGASTMQQLLNNVPEISGFGETNEFQAGSVAKNTGEEIPTIHNLGASSSISTLILINGHTLTPSGSLGITDPGILPVMAVQRVDVMPDGDSAIYGSSAVAGVIDFITRPDYEGIQTSVQYSWAADYNTEDEGLLAGHKWDSGSALIAFEHSSHGGLAEGNRSFSANTNLTSLGGSNFDSYNCDPATITQTSATSGTASNAFAYPYTGASFASVGNSQAATCDYDQSRSIIPSENQNKLWVSGKQRIFSWLTVGVDLSYDFRVDGLKGDPGTLSATAYGPTGSSSALGTLAQNPFYVGNSTTGTASEFIRYDFEDLLGPSLTKGGVQDFMGTTSFTADLGSGWEANLDDTGGLNNAFIISNNSLCAACAELALNGTPNTSGAVQNSVASSSITDDMNLGSITSVIRPLTTSNALDVWDPAATNKTSPTVIKQLKGAQTLEWDRDSQNDVRLKFDGPLFALPAGDLKLAFGTEWSMINLETITSSSNATGPTDTSSAFQIQSFPRSVTSFFAEFYIPVVSPDMGVPLVRKLTVNIAGRTDDYSDVGFTKNPKVGFAWDVFDGLSARGSYGTSFTAPNASAVGGANSISTAAAGSLAGTTIPTTHPNYPGSFCTVIVGPCNVTSVFGGINIGGANPTLKPETGLSYSFGLEVDAGEIWDPLKGLTATATYWQTKFDGFIVGINSAGTGFLNTPGLQHYLQLAPPGGWTITSPQVVAALAGKQIKSALPTPIYFIADTITGNGYDLEANGIDYAASYKLPTDQYGDFLFEVSGEEKLRWDLKGGPPDSNNPYQSYLNGHLNTTVIRAEQLEFRGSVDWRLDPVEMNLITNYTGAYWFPTSFPPFNLPTAISPVGYPGGGYEHIEPNVTFDLRTAYDLPNDLAYGLSSGTQVDINVFNLLNKRPPFLNTGTTTTYNTSFPGYDIYNANPLGRQVMLTLRKTW